MLYKIKPVGKTLFFRKYDVFYLEGLRLAQITQDASEYDTIVTSEGKRYLLGGDIDINLWMECPDGTVYETKIPGGLRIRYTYFIEFDGREITLKGRSIFENNELIGELKKEPIKWPEGILNKIKALFSLREWTLEIRDYIPEHIALFIIWIVLTVELKSEHEESRELKTLTLEKERKRFKRINIKETGKKDKLTKVIKVLAWLWFITAVIPGIILVVTLPYTLDPFTSLMLTIFLMSFILFAIPSLVLVLLKIIIYQLKKNIK